MINLNEASVSNCIIHKVGNKTRNESLVLSESELELNNEWEALLKNFCLRPFKEIKQVYQFHHLINLKMNEVYSCADNIFEEEDFVKNSKDIASHLFHQTRHNLIKSGELFVMVFTEIIFDNVVSNAIGIFKSERKENFIKINESDKNISAFIDRGISEYKLDKGCIILNSDYHQGFKVLTFEHHNNDTDYWRNDFLSIKTANDKLNQTTSFIKLCQEFSKFHIKESFGKNEQNNFMNNSLKYISKDSEVDIQKFENCFFEDADVRKEFIEFKHQYIQNNDIELPNKFEVSKDVVTIQKRKFRNEIKLDTKILIKMEGNDFTTTQDYIEKGFDKERSMHYYKIFYNTER